MRLATIYVTGSQHDLRDTGSAAHMQDGNGSRRTDDAQQAVKVIQCQADDCVIPVAPCMRDGGNEEEESSKVRDLIVQGNQTRLRRIDSRNERGCC
jgi:hypothetical protein